MANVSGEVASLAGRRTGRRPLAQVLALLLGCVRTVVVAGCSKTSTTSAGNAPATFARSGATGAPNTAGASAAGGSGTAQCPTSNTTAFVKTKFVAHTGLAFGAFHRYLFKPYRSGRFAHGSPGRIVAFVKAGLATAFIVHEVRIAAQDAKANPTLCQLVAAPLAEIGNTVRGAVTKLKGGDASGVSTLNTMIGSTEHNNGRAGAPITENPNPAIGG